MPEESSLIPTLARSIDVPALKERSIDVPALEERSIDVPGLEEPTNSFPENILTADSQELISNITMLMFHTVVALYINTMKMTLDFNINM